MTKCSWVFFAILSLATTPAFPSAGFGQDTIKVVDAAICGECRLNLDLAVSLGSVTDPYSVADIPGVQRDSQGRYLVTGATPGHVLLIYDSAGIFRGTLGNDGEGPGEFRGIYQVRAAQGDSLLIVDWGNRRVTMLDSSGDYVRSFPMPLVPSDVEETSEGWVWAGPAYRPETLGFPLHLVDKEGEILNSFGGRFAVVSSRPSLTQRMLARSDDGFWAARLERYEIEHWNGLGARTAVVDRRTDWFPDRTEGESDYGNEPAWLKDIFVDDHGRLWSVVVRRKSDPPPPGGSTVFPAWTRKYETVVEVMDPDQGRLLASVTYPWYGHGFTNEGHVVSHREAASGLIIVDVWRPTLTIGGPE